MPKMDGRECFAELQKINPNVCVILASGFSQAEDMQSLRNDGLYGFIRKPYRSAELSQMVAQAILDRRTES